MLRSKKGNALLNVLVAVGVLSIVMNVFLTANNEQIKAAQYISQKADVADARNLAMQVLNDPAVCDWQVASTSTMQKLDTTVVSDGYLGSEIKMDKVYSGGNSSSPVLFEADKALSTVGNLKVDKIAIRKIQPTGVTNRYLGTLMVSLKDGVRSLAPITIRKILLLKPVDAGNPATAQEVAGCGQASVGGDFEVSSYLKSCDWNQSSPSMKCLPPTCEAGDIDRGVVSCSVGYYAGSSSGVTRGGACTRTCHPKFATKRSLNINTCGWGTTTAFSFGGGNKFSCSPPACLGGEIDRGTSCTPLGMYQAGQDQIWGQCNRYCYSEI